MYYFSKLKPDRSILGLLPAIMSLIGFAFFVLRTTDGADYTDFLGWSIAQLGCGHKSFLLCGGDDVILA